MSFFRKKTPHEQGTEKPEEKSKESLQEIVQESVLTAEGWRRRLAVKEK